MEHLSKKTSGKKKTPHQNGKNSLQILCVLNKDNAQQDLKAWPEGEKINRSKFAREHKINAKNEGEVVKGLDGRAQGVWMCAKKVKTPGGGISIPCRKTAEQLNRLIQSGRLTLGEPCAPYRLDVHMQVPAPTMRVNCMFCPRPSV